MTKTKEEKISSVEPEVVSLSFPSGHGITLQSAKVPLADMIDWAITLKQQMEDKNSTKKNGGMIN